MRPSRRIAFKALLAALAMLAGAALWTQVLRPEPVLTVTSDPPAAVRLDGRFVGTTPLVLNRELRGPHLLRLEREGYRSQVRALELGGELRVEATLEPAPTATLVVESRPAGASVTLDGGLRGRTPLVLEGIEPGARHVEVLLVNYFPDAATVELAEGGRREVSFELSHRQVGAYRDRIKADPFDIAAYNDLGELLFVLGRYDEAAEVYAQGLVRASAKRSWSAAEKYNLAKLTREVRAKHKKAAFLDALSEEVIRLVGTGESAAKLLADFRTLPWSRHREAYLEALDAYIEANHDSAEILLDASRLARRVGWRDRSLELMREAFGLAGGRYNLNVELLADLVGLQRQESYAGSRELADKVVERLEGMTAGAGPKSRFLFEHARLAFVRGEFERGSDLAEKALEMQKANNISDEWRVQIAQQYLGRKMFERAAEHLHEVISHKQTKSKSYRRAQALLKRLPKELRTPPKKK